MSNQTTAATAASDISSSVESFAHRSSSIVAADDSMPPSPSTPGSSVDSHNISSPTPITDKHGRNPYAPPAQTWTAWLCDKYTIQYTFPPAYAQGVLQVSNIVFPLGVLFGLCLPRTLSFLWKSLTLTAGSAFKDGSNDGQWVSWYQMPQLHMYLLAWTVFHMLEFNVTASYNPTRLFSDSFLLNNGKHYHYAHLFSLLEFCLTSYLSPASKTQGLLTYVGLALMLFGQLFRSLAMIHANNNFSHVLAWKKRTDHKLVTDGVYAWVRHPSYVGFAYWALGTQLMLGNKLALLGFAGILWLFFSRRIRAEEGALVEFFGQEYKEYRKKVGTGLPFIR